jgi:hypothetical protein
VALVMFSACRDNQKPVNKIQGDNTMTNLFDKTMTALLLTLAAVSVSYGLHLMALIQSLKG